MRRRASMRPWDHPRSRGENGLLLRGVDKATGSSPLTRGKRSGRAARTQTRGDHPRSRGENLGDAEAPGYHWGSSPLTRGKRLTDLDQSQTLGIIPAHAGKTRTRPDLIRAPGDHPRSRGENHTRKILNPWLGGSSPLTRGKLASVSSNAPCARIIPAHAGKTTPRRRTPLTSRDHPRSRGENMTQPGEDMQATGSSPLTRGKPSVLAGLRSHEEDHPRSRGENTS